MKDPRRLLTALVLLSLSSTAFAETTDALQTLKNAIKEQRQMKEAKEAPDDSKSALSDEVLTEPLRAMTLAQALAVAIAKNPQYKADMAKIDIMNAEIISAGARYNPALVTDNGVAEKTYRLGLEQTLELGGKRKRRIELAKAQREALLSEINTQLLDLRAQVRQAYTRLYNAREREATYRNILQVAQELTTIAKKREQAGDIATLDTLQTEILGINANNDLQLAITETVNSQSELNALLHQPLTTDLTLSPPSLEPHLEAATPDAAPAPEGVLQGQVKAVALDLKLLLEAALTHRPEKAQILNEIRVAERQLALAKANRIPNLTVSAGGDWVTGSEQATGVFAVGRVEVPVLNRQQGPIREAMARKSQLQQELEALKNRITLEVNKAYTSYTANRERLQRYESQLLPYSVAVVEKSRLAFKEGKTNILTAINAQQAYMSTRLGYLHALMDYQNAISQLERAVGTGL